ncbi:MAG: S8 family serine peptidase [Richelia sp. RM2_1_2]|nr:S8 family serine peptidase [Richelia sp. SM2_1_7]NJM19802.1 S8 family serine peptidase [Richelia sp. SM1_7_0]NJN09816.1 S8 family serine peptidase [Richelia sp. RM1_1_1]NJO30770.1 S8 family serine peptidase [Richelia sp. SL_2_1]NJO60029.1 S8 family serine peptidase [Richelia sp. RM2_1_2]
MSENAPRGYVDSATQFSINTSPQIFRDTVSSLEANDLYTFNLKGRSSFDLTLDGLSADADVILIQDGNGNGKFDKDEIITYSNNAGKLAESIRTDLGQGTYYIEIYPYGNIQTNYRLSVSGVPFDSAGNTINDAREVAIDSQAQSISDWVGKLDSRDYYKFNLDNTSDLNIVLDGLSADADLRLLSSQGNILASSVNIGTLDEKIAQTLVEGTYYLQVNSYNNSETYYNLNFSASPVEIIPTSADNTTVNAGTASVSSPIPTSAIPQTTNTFLGTLRADTFTYQPGYSRTVFSGNGNVDYGSGARDLLDLSDFISSSVILNYANTPDGGVVYNSGNGNRIFDALTFGDGREILFEGIETIKFADTTMDLSVTPNDPLFNQQWNLHGMGVHNAWRFTTGSNNVIIGIQDTGLGTDSSGNIHPDLRGTNFIGKNYLDEWSKSSNFSHGTLVQGTIAAASNNGIGGAGINWNSEVINIDVVGDDAPDYNLATATQAMIEQSKAQGKRLVVNISLAGGYSPEFEQLIADNQNTALFVIASGNANTNSIASPADLAQKYGNVVAVGSSWGTTDYFGNAKTPGERISYDNWWGSNYGNGLTVTAPSEFISTSANRDASGNFDFGYNQNFNGTSASTANVSGVASLLWSVNPNLSATQIKAIISETAYDLGNQGYDTVYGNGFINADAGVRRALAIARGFA